MTAQPEVKEGDPPLYVTCVMYDKHNSQAQAVAQYVKRCGNAPLIIWHRPDGQWSLGPVTVEGVTE